MKTEEAEVRITHLQAKAHQRLTAAMINEEKVVTDSIQLPGESNTSATLMSTFWSLGQ